MNKAIGYIFCFVIIIAYCAAINTACSATLTQERLDYYSGRVAVLKGQTEALYAEAVKTIDELVEWAKTGQVPTQEQVIEYVRKAEALKRNAELIYSDAKALYAEAKAEIQGRAHDVMDKIETIIDIIEGLR